jgi:hypothetical protein
MGGARRIGLGLLVALALPACAQSRGVGVHWEEYLPALPGPTQPQPHGVPGCRRATVACVDREIRHMERVQQRLGCDHRAVFDTTYLELTRALRTALRTRPDLFPRPHYLFYEDALFADVYFRTLRSWSAGRPIPPAWRIALDTARGGEVNAGQDMLLGINAHVQNDMPFVLAALGLRTPRGRSRKRDHDAVNEVLDAAYPQVVHAIARRYDPLLTLTNADWDPLDDIGGLELVRGWREGVWRNAERLVAARDGAERAQVAQEISENAGAWAQAMAAEPQPGYRAQRDAYCRRALGLAQ